MTVREERRVRREEIVLVATREQRQVSQKEAKYFKF